VAQLPASATHGSPLSSREESDVGLHRGYAESGVSSALGDPPAALGFGRAAVTLCLNGPMKPNTRSHSVGSDLQDIESMQEHFSNSSKIKIPR